MSKSKQKKHSRRSRREHGDSAPKLDRSITAASQSVPTTSSSSNTTNANEPQSSVSASFVAGDKPRARDEHGIVTELAALEYPAIRKDLRKLAITLVSFAVVLAGLAVLAAQTSVVHDLGHGVYGLAK